MWRVFEDQRELLLQVGVELQQGRSVLLRLAPGNSQDDGLSRHHDTVGILMAPPSLSAQAS